VLLLDHGQAVERGTHEELLEHGGRYAALWLQEKGEVIGA
jgi:ATP-binding cassette subfamily B protein